VAVYDADGNATLTAVRAGAGGGSSTHEVSAPCGLLEGPVFRSAPLRPGPTWRFELPFIPNAYQ
jgi:hypothetical protein